MHGDRKDASLKIYLHIRQFGVRSKQVQKENTVFFSYLNLGHAPAAGRGCRSQPGEKLVYITSKPLYEIIWAGIGSWHAEISRVQAAAPL